VARLGARGLTYDTWHYHFQNREFLELARAIPDTVMVLDHFGTPIGVGRYADRRDEMFEEWKRDITDVARCRPPADLRRVRLRAGPLLPPHDRDLRRRPLHVRVELPRRPDVTFVPR